jgi:hypothetical protein
MFQRIASIFLEILLGFFCRWWRRTFSFSPGQKFQPWQTTKICAPPSSLPATYSLATYPIAVRNFRWLGQLGLPHATRQATEQLHQRFESASRRVQDALEARMLDKMIKAATKLFTGAWPPQADPDFLAQALINHSATTFESALDAATLIFAHSVLDSAALDWCRVCALAAPDDFLPLINQKKVTLADVQAAASVAALRAPALEAYINSLVRIPLV